MPTSGERNPVGARRLLCWATAGAILFGAGALGRPVAGAQDRLTGPVPAEVLSVIDGDTLEVRAVIWLGQTVSTRVRLSGVDTPELKGKCARERALAQRARAYLLDRLGPGDGGRARVRLRDIRFGKYAGRVLARVETARGEDLGQGLMAAGLARAYAGGARATWCQEAGAPTSG
jgi:endonuclease YncB( thermonuclease family)